LLRAIARWSCAFVIFERPAIPSWVARRYSSSLVPSAELEVRRAALDDDRVRELEAFPLRVFALEPLDLDEAGRCALRSVRPGVLCSLRPAPEACSASPPLRFEPSSSESSPPISFLVRPTAAGTATPRAAPAAIFVGVEIFGITTTSSCGAGLSPSPR
jgi:hypothetical protein